MSPKSAKSKVWAIQTTNSRWAIQTLNSRVLPDTLNAMSAKGITVFAIHPSAAIGGAYEVISYDNNEPASE